MTGTSWRRIATWTIRLLLVGVLGLVTFAVAVLIVVPRALHGEALDVLTGSMTPKIPVGSIVVVRPVDTAALHVGDVATYQKEPGKAEYITHRIVAINPKTTPTTFTFKGDANRGPDIKPVPATAIRGKVVFHVPYLGSLRDAMHTKGGITGLALLLLAGYALYQAYGALTDRRPGGTRAREETPASERDPTMAPTVLVAKFANQALDGLSPRVFALLLHGTLVEVDEELHTCTVRLLMGENELAEAAMILGSFQPISVHRSGGLARQREPIRELAHSAVASGAGDA